MGKRSHPNAAVTQGRFPKFCWKSGAFTATV